MIEENKDLKKLVNLVSKKYSTTITFESKESDFEIHLDYPIILDNDLEYEIGVRFFSVYNSVFNVTKHNNVFKFGDKITKVDPGAYEIKEINEFLQNKLGVDKISIKGDTSIMKCRMMNKSEVDFSIENSINKIFGFENKKYAPGSYISETNPDITDITTINIECDITSGGYFGVEKEAKRKNIIYSFLAYSVPLGGKYYEINNPPIYYPIDKKHIDKIRIRILDQKERIINFNNERICICLHLKQI